MKTHDFNAVVVPLVLIACALSLYAQETRRAIRGTVRNGTGPLAGVKVKLTMYRDEKCAKLSGTPSGQLTADDEQFLKGCDAANSKTEVNTDNEGRYRFPSLTSGWYRLTFERSPTQLLKEPILAV